MRIRFVLLVGPVKNGFKRSVMWTLTTSGWGRSIQLTAYDAAWTLTPKKLLLAT